MFHVPRRKWGWVVPLKVDIVTAERIVFSEEGVDELVVPGVEGELAVLPRHAALMTMIQPGVMRIIKGGEETEMAITGEATQTVDATGRVVAGPASPLPTGTPIDPHQED